MENKLVKKIQENLFYILVLKLPENSVFLKVFVKKCFHQNDASSLKLTVSFSVGGFNGNC